MASFREVEYMDEPISRRRRRRRRRRRGGLRTLLVLILLAAAVFAAYKLTNGFADLRLPVKVSLDNTNTEFDYDLDRLAGQIVPGMYVGDCGPLEAEELRECAKKNSEWADELEFMAEHISIYTEDAVKTALLGPEKTPFALLSAFCEPNSSGLDAEISVDEGEIPYLLQYDSRWCFHGYGSSFMGFTGCGPTCLSMALIGLTGNTDYTPAYVADRAEAAGHYVPGAGTAWSLFTEGAAEFGLRGEAISAGRRELSRLLDEGSIVVASMLPGDFTTSGHFILIYGSNLLGFKVYDPNSIERSERLWSYDTLAPQIAQLWSLSLASGQIDSGGTAPADSGEAGDIYLADCEEFITLRAEPDVGADAITTIPKGGEMTLVSFDGDFALVEYQGERGYVLASYIEPKAAGAGLAHAQSASGAAFIADCEEFVTLRAEPDVESRELGTIPRGGEMTLVAFDGAFALVDYAGQRGYVLSTYIVPKLDSASPGGGFGYADLQEGLERLAAEHPEELELSSIGQSAEGRELLLAVVGSEGAEYELLIQGCIHGRENMSAYLVLSQLEHLLKSGVPEDVRFHFIPMVNPDGAEISRTGVLGEAQREIYLSDLAAGYTEAGEAEYARAWKANAAGVDLNRNFDAGWAQLDSRAAPSCENYRGGAPEDQPESRALADYTRAILPDATLSYHTAGSLIYADYAGASEAVNAASRSLGTALGQAAGYPLEDSGDLDSGGYKDWAAALGIPSVTIELGYGDSPQRAGAYPTVRLRNESAPLVAAEWLRGN